MTCKACGVLLDGTTAVSSEEDECTCEDCAGPYECAECGMDDHPSSECPHREDQAAPFCVLAGPNQHNVAVICPAAPDKVTDFRVVLFNAERSKLKELVYWISDEWQYDDDLECIGAIAGAIRAVNEGDAFTEAQQRRAGIPWEKC